LFDCADYVLQFLGASLNHFEMLGDKVENPLLSLAAEPKRPSKGPKPEQA
jgi:hypothetical protein